MWRQSLLDSGFRWGLETGAMTVRSSAKVTAEGQSISQRLLRFFRNWIQPKVDIPSSDLNEAAAATDAELRRLRSKSLADRLAQLIPEAWHEKAFGSQGYMSVITWTQGISSF